MFVRSIGVRPEFLPVSFPKRSSTKRIKGRSTENFFSRLKSTENSHTNPSGISLPISRQASSEVSSVLHGPHLLPSPIFHMQLTRKIWHMLLHICKNRTIAYLQQCIAYQERFSTNYRALQKKWYNNVMSPGRQNCACPSAPPRPSQHLRCTSVILSTGLQMPVQFQSKEAAHGFPACAFHSQSARSSEIHETCTGYSKTL
jgi:hypothetical protein